MMNKLLSRILWSIVMLFGIIMASASPEVMLYGYGFNALFSGTGSGDFLGGLDVIIIVFSVFIPSLVWHKFNKDLEDKNLNLSSKIKAWISVLAIFVNVILFKFISVSWGLFPGILVVYSDVCFYISAIMFGLYLLVAIRESI